MIQGKKVRNSVILLMFIVFLLGSFSFVFAAENETPAPNATGSKTISTTMTGEGLPEWAKKIPGVSFFVGGYTENTSAVAEFAKLLFLFLLIVLIYSSLSFADFPKGQHVIRMIIAIIVGILSSLLMTTDEVIAILESYKALGLSITIFVPIMILTFFTFVVATKLDPFGILAQRILWIIYSSYLFLKTAGLLMLKWFVAFDGATVSGAWDQFFSFLLGANYANSFMNSANSLTLVILFIVSITVFVIFVASNKPVVYWLAKEQRDADVERFKDRVNRTDAVEEARSESTRK